jgi:hypothetical protein
MALSYCWKLTSNIAALLLCVRCSSFTSCLNTVRIMGT